MVSSWFLGCVRCGKCCNSAPLMSVPELFYHQHTFIGCLGIRRMSRHALGDRLGAPNGAFLHRGDRFDVLLATQAFDDPTLKRCPALGTLGECTIHDDGKPLECRVVPLDSLAPDRLQPEVLAARRIEGEARGATCISTRCRAGYLPVFGGGAVAGEQGAGEQGAGAMAGGAPTGGGFRQALDERRRSLVDEKRFWGDAVFRALRRDLLAEGEVSGVPEHGLLVMSMVPVLIELAEVSEPCSARIEEFLDAQIFHGERALRATQARTPANEATVHQLRALTAANCRLRSALNARGARTNARPLAERSAIEAWLGILPCR